MRLTENARRACIYFIYDRDGVIDDYILYQLRELRKSVDFIHCVINGTLQERGKKALQEVADEVYERENKGVDIGAYKAAINHIGWDKLDTFDELVLMNNTCFGPVYPFEEAFHWATGQDVDFWGLTYDLKSNWNHNNKYLHYNKDIKHIQSYFLVLRQKLLGSEFIKNFFHEIPENTGYIDSGIVYEYAFPGYFEKYGYKGAVYCDDKDFNYPLLHNPVGLLKKYRMPLIKKRSFFHHYTDVLSNTAGEATAELIEYLEKHTGYNMAYIWTNMLRTADLANLVRCAQLNRVLPRDFLLPSSKECPMKLGLVYHMYYEDLFRESIADIKKFPKYTKIYITTTSEDKKEVIQSILAEENISAEVVVIENRGRDVSSLLVAARNFVEGCDLVCFFHDKKSTQNKPYSIGRSWSYKLRQNVFATKEYVNNVIQLFMREPFLGIAFPSAPNHGVFAEAVGDGWTGNYDNTKKLLDILHVKSRVTKHALCVAPLGTCFWFRPKALEKLFRGLNGKGWRYEDFPLEPNKVDHTILHAVERAYAYCAQDAGYYPAYIYNDKFTQIELTNLEFNKTGSSSMRAWCDIIAMKGIGMLDTKGANDDDLLNGYVPPINYGIRKSLVHLALALRCRFPVAWAMFKPIRLLGKKILRIRT